MDTDDDSGRLTTEEFAQWWKQTGEHELRQILFWRWDPIGVADLFPNTADEYDGYAPQLARVLRNGSTDEAIVSMLIHFEHDAMGLNPARDVERLRTLAGFLREWFESSQDSWRDLGPLRR